MKVICFDLEGPLATQDNAFELMKLFPGGGDIFQSISRYDDLITLEERDDYEPGDTLSLIAPFLVYHKIKERNISELAVKAKLVNGALELIEHLGYPQQQRELLETLIISAQESHRVQIAG